MCAPLSAGDVFTHGNTPVILLLYYSPLAIPSIQLIYDHNIGIIINITLNMCHVRILVSVLQLISNRPNIDISITINIRPSEYWY